MFVFFQKKNKYKEQDVSIFTSDQITKTYTYSKECKETIWQSLVKLVTSIFIYSSSKLYIFRAHKKLMICLTVCNHQKKKKSLSVYAKNHSLTVLKARIIVFDSQARTYLHEKTMAEQMLLPGTPSRSYKMAVLASIHRSCGMSYYRCP